MASPVPHKKSRKENEKRRRDAFNVVINELSNVILNGKKVEKVHVIEAALHTIARIHKTFQKGKMLCDTPSDSLFPFSAFQSFRLHLDALWLSVLCFRPNGCVVRAAGASPAVDGVGMAPQGMDKYLPSTVWEKVQEWIASGEEKMEYSMETPEWMRFYRLSPDLVMCVVGARPRDSSSSQAFSLSLNQHMQCIKSSPSATSVLGFSSFQLLGKSFPAMVHNADLRYALQQFAKLASCPEGILLSPIRISTRNGNYVTVRAHVAMTADGSILCEFSTEKKAEASKKNEETTHEEAKAFNEHQQVLRFLEKHQKELREKIAMKEMELTQLLRLTSE